MDTNAYAVRLTSWVNLIREANTSGLPKKVWCKEHDISTRKFYYWQQKVRSYLMENADLCPTSLSNSKAEMSIHSVTPGSSCDRDRYFEISEPSALFDETCQDPPPRAGARKWSCFNYDDPARQLSGLPGKQCFPLCPGGSSEGGS